MSTTLARLSLPIFLRYLGNDILHKYINCEKQPYMILKKCFTLTFPNQSCLKCLPLVSKVVHRRFISKSNKQDEVDSDSDSEEDFSDTEMEEDERTNFPPESDPNLPSQYTDTVVYAVRADQVVGKTLVKSSTAATKLFYEGKLRINNKKLIKKATKVKDNDILDLIHEVKEKEVVITRVKVLKVLDSKTKSGKPKTVVRIWKKEFSIDRLKT